MDFADGGAIPDIEAGRGVLIPIDGVGVAVFRTEDEGFLAVDDRCPHAGGPLHQGRLVGGVVTCPWHAFRFCGSTGACLVGPDRPGVRARVVRVEDGRLRVER